MMKYVFVLALLHLCVSVKSDTNLNKEIIDRLNKLRQKVNSTSDVKAPAAKTLKCPKKCLGMIKKELLNLLDNLPVHDEDSHYILELKGNLNALGAHKVNDDCNMDERKPKLALRSYIDFFRKLNTRA